MYSEMERTGEEAEITYFMFPSQHSYKYVCKLIHKFDDSVLVGYELDSYNCQML
jgi:hypothetical protein